MMSLTPKTVARAEVDSEHGKLSVLIKDDATCWVVVQGQKMQLISEDACCEIEDQTGNSDGLATLDSLGIEYDTWTDALLTIIAGL